ncbi:MAG: hypothetical protein JSV03_04925, partial [Planctomycetota bacterium]
DMTSDQRTDPQAGRRKTGLPRSMGSATKQLSNQQLNEMTLEELIQIDPETRFNVARAHNIYCYANTIESLQQYPKITETDRYRPTPEEMWEAQVGLWIEEDIIGALADLNNSVAEKLTAAGKHPWVGNLPVKRILGFWIGGYVPPVSDTGSSGKGSIGGLGASGHGSQLAVGPPPTNANAVFTNNGCTTSVDVIQFAINLVVEAKMLPSVINALCEAGFYTPLKITYVAIPQQKFPDGYVYGSAPAIEVRLVFEGCFLRSKYEKWMPQIVKDDIAGGKATISSGGYAPGGPGPSRHGDPGGGYEDMF